MTIFCARANCGGTIVKGQDGPVCHLCGRAPESSIVRCTVIEKGEEKRMPRGVPGSGTYSRAKAGGNGRQLLAPDEHTSRSPAGDALSRYSQATGTYIRLREQLVALEAKAEGLRKEMAEAFAAMKAARERLDGFLAGEPIAPGAGRRVVSEEVRQRISEGVRATRASQREAAEPEPEAVEA